MVTITTGTAHQIKAAKAVEVTCPEAADGVAVAALRKLWVMSPL